MRAVDIIYKKRNGEVLSKNEIDFIIDGYVNGEIPDYQVSSLLMAVYFNGLDGNETAFLTNAMINSGKRIDLSVIKEIKVDKHSTGGVGDKLSLLIAPLAAACGVKVPMMCGRGLGHTGGTLDKLQSISNYRVFLSEDEIINTINKCGFVFIGQTEEIVPADKKLYALRDVTATVESIPLITASIMSKKFAEGCDSLVMDVKCGDGAFMKNYNDALNLAKSIVNIGKKLNKNVVALITSMDEPLGRTIGNHIEVKETLDILKNCKVSYDLKVPKEFELSEDVIDLTIKIVTEMVLLSKKESDYKKAEEMVIFALNSGRGYELLLKNIILQGGETGSLDRLQTVFKKDILAKKSGYITKIEAFNYGIASMLLGAGRKKVDDKIDYAAGIIFNKKSGFYVNEGEVIAEVYYNNCDDFKRVEDLCYSSITIEDIPKETKNIVIDRIV